jgi:penicillin amidase
LALSALTPDPLIDKLTRLGGASNNWVVDGRFTKSGKPLLANDPHLGLSAPGIWYLVHLAFPFGDVVGATIPGIPSVILGHNGHFAWGLTTAQVDTEDLVAETIDPDDPSRYLTPAGSQLFETRIAEINVRLGAAKRVTLKATRNGPVLPPVFPALVQATPKNAVMALAAAGLSRADTTMDAAIMLMSAHNRPAFDAAMMKFQAPVQNVVYADTQGDIGYMLPSLIPIRGTNAPAKSLVPAAGRNQDALWTGYIPYQDLPHMFNPPSGRIYTANNKIAADDYPYFLAAEWPAAYRARRIRELLSAGAPWDIAYMHRMQMDNRSPDAEVLLPLLLHTKFASARDAEAAKLLAKWNCEMSGDRAEPLIYIAWATAFQHLIVADELKKLAGEMRALKPEFLVRVLTNTDGLAHWCDDVKTPAVETCDEVSARALTNALDLLGKTYGDDMSKWRWDAAHLARFNHDALGSIPLLGDFFNRAIPMDGGPNSLNRGDMPYAGAMPWSDVHGAGLRAIYDLSDLERSRFMIEIGQSGNPLSPHYDDYMKAWALGGSFEITSDARKYTEGALGTWVLTPTR